MPKLMTITKPSGARMISHRSGVAITWAAIARIGEQHRDDAGQQDARRHVIVNRQHVGPQARIAGGARNTDRGGGIHAGRGAGRTGSASHLLCTGEGPVPMPIYRGCTKGIQGKPDRSPAADPLSVTRLAQDFAQGSAHSWVFSMIVSSRSSASTLCVSSGRKVIWWRAPRYGFDQQQRVEQDRHDQALGVVELGQGAQLGQRLVPRRRGILDRRRPARLTSPYPLNSCKRLA